MRPFGKPPRWCSARPTRCSNVAIERVVAKLANEINRADIDPQFQRSRRDQRFSSPRFKRSSASSRSLAERLP